jgi:hypothetical protein
VNPPAVLDVPAPPTASGAIAVAIDAEPQTASGAVQVVVVTPFHPVPADEVASAPVEDPVDFEHGASVLARATSVSEVDSPSAVPGSPFGV